MNKSKKSYLQQIERVRRQRQSGLSQKTKLPSPTPEQSPKIDIKSFRSDRIPSDQKAIRRSFLKAHASNKILNIDENTIFITGGIGDIFALESFFTDELRENLKTIVYATQKAEPIRELFCSLPNYPKLENHITVWSDFSDFWCFFGKDDCIRRLIAEKQPIPDELAASADWSILTKFGSLDTYNSSSFIEHELCSISHFDLPDDYYCICPYSTDKRISQRDFTKVDWDAVLCNLERLDTYGVVINHGNDEYFPESDRLVVLQNQTSILEAVEILKNASGYFGIDTFLSVLATKRFPEKYVQIKSVNVHCVRNKSVYFAPADIKLKSNIVEISRHESPKNDISLIVPQGLGDIFWIYQKFAPQVDEINFNIAVVENGNAIESRSKDWLTLLPKVKSVNFHKVSGRTYQKLASDFWTMDDTLTQNVSKVLYGCNRWLEEGHRLEDIDPHYEVEWGVSIETVPINVPEQFVSMYVSGAMKHIDPNQHKTWNLDEWAQFVQLFYEKHELTCPIVLVGASFDVEVMKELSHKLSIESHLMVQAKPAQVCYALTKSMFFIGYQSGLGIMADNLDVPQLMMYFDFLDKMKYTWCKPDHPEKVFFASTFSNPPQEVIQKINWSAS